MTPLYIYNGGLLVKDGALAVSRDCCCGCVICITPFTFGANNSPTSIPPTPSCTGIYEEWKFQAEPTNTCFDDTWVACGGAYVTVDTSSWPLYTYYLGCSNECILTANQTLTFRMGKLIEKKDSDVGQNTKFSFTQAAFPGVDIVVNYSGVSGILSEYPPDCWNIFYKNEVGESIERYQTCLPYVRNYNNRGYRNNIKIYAIAGCCCESGVESQILDITGDFIISESGVDPGAIQLGTCDWWSYILTYGSTPPAIPFIPSIQPQISCYEECPQIPSPTG